MNHPEPDISVKVDLTNPGQFFACCGLLELADRLWPGAEGWFDQSIRSFFVRGAKNSRVEARKLIKSLIECAVTNTMSDVEAQRRDELRSLLKEINKEMKTAEGDEKKCLEPQRKQLEKEKKELESLWRENPVVLGAPFEMRIDWFLDDFADGSRFKTWAGQQSVIDIAKKMMEPIRSGTWGEIDPSEWLIEPSHSKSVPFNFDSNLGPQASSLDVGYSLDALKVSTRMRPFVEIGAFIGLQRFRPRPVGGKNRFLYCAWNTPLTVRVASVVACAALALPESTGFEFRLLYRTKYLKSFLPAVPIERGSRDLLSE